MGYAMLSEAAPLADRSDPDQPEWQSRSSGIGELLLETRYDFWIQTARNRSVGIEDAIYLSTFQKGRGQHITVLDTDQARELGHRLLVLADEIDSAAGAVDPRLRSIVLAEDEDHGL